jgi:hypothetical protein
MSSSFLPTGSVTDRNIVLGIAPTAPAGIPSGVQVMYSTVTGTYFRGPSGTIVLGGGASPVIDTDFATKGYVDNKVSGGVTGPQGPTGSAGPTGPQGPTGAAAPFFDVSVSTCVFTGIGAVNQVHGQTAVAFNTIPSSVFRIESLGGPTIITFHGSIGATGPIAGAAKNGVMQTRIAVGSAAGMAYTRSSQASLGYQSVGMQHVVLLPSGSFTGAIQWRVQSGNIANLLGEGNVAVLAMAP